MVAGGQRPSPAMSQALRPRWSVLWPSRLRVIRQARPGTAAVSFNNRCNGTEPSSSTLLLSHLGSLLAL
ncbi:unnamed protein product [Triticum turgidum subsp. durum]|uniref:Uncharacterized protein n=1 Tax=Triticum turgidum subsp. durum TaxID=4567 RepID=A0A9R0VGW9_TRITD|nr:unnamed protein product [Triticum turgidum subsp. durum]